MALTLITCTIAAGQSLSNGVPLTAGRLVRIRTPAAWKPANLTFQCSSADVPAQYRDVYGRMGAEIVISSVRPNTVIGLPAEVTAFLQDAWLKIRSGHAGIAVPQLSQCDFELVLYKGPTTTTTLNPLDRLHPLDEDGQNGGDGGQDGA
jgi:hypothetical protein